MQTPKELTTTMEINPPRAAGKAHGIVLMPTSDLIPSDKSITLSNPLPFGLPFLQDQTGFT